MFDLDRWREIFQSMGKNKLRTILSGFTITFAILLFTILLGMGNGLKNTFESFFSRDAENAMFIMPERTTKAYKGFQSGRRIEFKNEDIAYIAKNYGDKIDELIRSTNYNLRNIQDFQIPHAKTLQFHKSFLLSVINIWNGLQDAIKSQETLIGFKK